MQESVSPNENREEHEGHAGSNEGEEDEESEAGREEDRMQEEGEKEEEEAQAPRAVKPPVKPTKEEVSEHMISHLPFRAWCAHCVRKVEVKGASQER